MACGFHMTQYFDGIETMFENHKHLVWFKSYLELVRWVEYYLNQPNERKRIYLEGRKLLEKKHTYKVRAEEIISHWRNIAGI